MRNPWNEQKVDGDFKPVLCVFQTHQFLEPGGQRPRLAGAHLYVLKHSEETSGCSAGGLATRGC